ncbi:MAG TPA: glucosaminidase domain-containing protein [Hanamia sp.]|nr:glucosaminidase domain-containing protein [Hanamia sp.]
MNRIIIILFFSFGCFFECAAQNMTAQEYIQQYKDLAINEMKRMGVPAAITLAQGLLETENGNSDLLKASNNHFGIKCKSTWTAETVSHDDDAPGECFRKYKTAEDSYRDHSNFLRGNSRYDFLFKLDPSDYKGWAYGLRKAGYATNPRYPEILIKNIEDNNLQQYTLEGLKEVARFDATKYSDDPEKKDSENVNQTASVAPVSLTINGAKALYVPKGTSLLAVATENHINLEKLLSINDLTKDGLLDKGQYIFVEKKKKEGETDFCISKPGETLYDISQKYGVVLQNLYAYNQLTPDDFLVAGTKIFLKPQEKNVANATRRNTKDEIELKTSFTGKPAVHTVQPKESLYSISKKYAVSVDDLKTWNHLSGNDIKIGQQLIISK